MNGDRGWQRLPALLGSGVQPSYQVGGEGWVGHCADGGDATSIVFAGHHGGKPSEVGVVVAEKHLRAFSDQSVRPVRRGRTVRQRDPVGFSHDSELFGEVGELLVTSSGGFCQKRWL